MDAFSSFRSRQLAAPRMLFMDHNSATGNHLDADSMEDSSDSNLTRSQTFLEDLHVVGLIIKKKKNFFYFFKFF